jgi:hypothetical protein
MPLRRAGTVPNTVFFYGPGSAAHHAEDGALRCVRGAKIPYFSVAVSASENSSSVRSSRSGVTET